MASLKFLKGRMKSVKSTQKITKAMQLISAARLNKAREALTSAIPYNQEVHRLIQAIAPNIKENNSLFTEKEGGHKHLIIAAASDRGLCGSFNSSVTKRVKEHCKGLKNAQEEFIILCVGNRIADSLTSYFGSDVVKKMPHSKQLCALDVETIAEAVLQYFANESFNTCTLIYNSFISVMKYETAVKQILPYICPNEESSQYSYEPELSLMIEELAERYLIASINEALLNSAVSEHSARMTAMDNATRNAREMLQKLGHQYNRTRQALITKELIEIISGAQAV